MPRSPAKFEVWHLAPESDHVWHAVGEDVHRAFWRAALAFVLKAVDEQLASGLDRRGEALAPIARATRKHRESEMGPADPSAPPLMPARGVSRTRLNLSGRAYKDHVECFWLDGWGKILRYHAMGKGRYGRIPVRNVIGISPASLRKVERWCDGWWLGYKRTKSLEVARKPLRAARVAPAALAVAGRTDYERFTYGIGGGSAAESVALLARGRATGFVQHAGPRGFEPEPPIGPGNPFGPRPDRAAEIKARRGREFAEKVKRAGEKAEREAKRAKAGPVVEVRGEVSPEIRERARKAVEAFPGHVRKALRDHGVKVVVARSTEEAAPGLAGLTPRGWPAGSTWANADGLYDSRDKLVIAAEHRRAFPGGEEVPSGRTVGVLRHESGHAFDEATGLPSGSAEFFGAHAADAADMDDATRARFGYYLQAGHVGPEEAFAELFGQLLGGGGSWLDLIAAFARSAEIVRRMLR